MAGEAVGHDGAREVDVRPRQAGDELAQEQRRDDRAGVALADVLDVGDAAVDVAPVLLDQRQLPQHLVGVGGGGDQLADQPAVGAEDGGAARPERGAHRRGQRGEVDDAVGPLARRVGQRVGEHQATLGVGVEDLDGRAVVGAQHVAGADRACRSACSRRWRCSRAPRPAGAAPAAPTSRPSTTAAPAMSRFCACIESAVFSDRPPLSKVMPLPTSATRRRGRGGR